MTQLKHTNTQTKQSIFFGFFYEISLQYTGRERDGNTTGKGHSF